jgi:CelD/BcsL family acetyltransferase involved in cellulose biosynthesis
VSLDKTPYTFDLIETSGALADLRQSWETLFEGSYNPSLFSRWEWNYAWWQSFSQKNDRLSLVWANRHGKPFGIAPFFVRPSSYYGLPRRLLRFLGGRHSDRADILIREPDPIFYNALFSFLYERVNWDVIYLREIPAESPFLEWIRNSTMMAFMEKDSICPYIPLTPDMNPESFQASLSSNIRKEFRKVKNRLAEMGESSVQHRSLIGPGDPLLERIREIEINSAKATRNIHLVFSPETNFSFQQNLLAQESDSIHPLLSTLELNGEIVAYLYGFIMNHIYHAYNTAFSLDFSRLSPGKLLIQETIEHCIREGLREFDFLRGNSYLKSKWTDRVRTQYHLTIFRDTLLNQLHQRIVFGLRPKIKPLLNRLLEKINRLIK